MADDKKHVYDESKIKTLSSLDHIRLRTGMYIGRIGDGSHQDDGCYVLMKEVVDNTIDEFIMGHGKEVNIKVEGTRVSVRDCGRGIPLGKVIECVSQINTGAKFRFPLRLERGGDQVSVARIFLGAVGLSFGWPQAVESAPLSTVAIVSGSWAVSLQS